jgi:hypothetical protein
MYCVDVCLWFSLAEIWAGLTITNAMKRFWYGSLFLALLFLFLPVRTLAQCGVERWSVKTGTDPDAGLLNLSSPTATTISSLSAIAAPTTLPDNQRVQPTETTIWVLNATLTKFVLAYDSDYHMVLTDAAGRTMIAEIPSPNCVGPGSPLAAAIAHARAQFDAMFTATTAFQTVNIPVQITGAGFFDYLEGQDGLAPNGIELHPVIDIIFNPYFSLSSSALSMTVGQGGTGSSTITSTLSGSFNSSIALSASGLPAGATAIFSPSSIAAPGAGSSTLTISVGASTPVGTYGVIVTGTGGGQTHSTSFNLTVTTGGSTVQQLLGNTGFENGSSNPAPWTVSSGVIDNSSFQASHTGSWKAWLNGYGSVHTDTLLQSVSIPSTVTNAALSFWLHIDTAETAYVANDTLKIQVRNSSGTVLATLATYSNLTANTGYRQVSFDLTPYKGQTIQIYLIGVENSKLKTSFVVDDFALNATTSGTPADFTISASPSALAITRGSSGTSTITTTLSGSFNSAIALSASGLPAGATASFSPSSVAAPGGGSSTLTISVGASTAVGTYNVTVTGTGGGKTHTTGISLTVNSSGGGTTQQLLGNPGFENGSSTPAPWTVSAGVIDSNSTAEAPYTGTWKAWLNGYGSVHTDTLLQSATISSTATTATLSFWLHIDTAETSTTKAYDTLKVQVRNSSGTVLATLQTYSNLNAAAGYAQVSFDLSSYKGQTIQVYLIGVEDSSLKTSFVVDDFVLNVTTP